MNSRHIRRCFTTLITFLWIELRRRICMTVRRIPGQYEIPSFDVESIWVSYIREAGSVRQYHHWAASIWEVGWGGGRSGSPGDYSWLWPSPSAVALSGAWPETDLTMTSHVSHICMKIVRTLHYLCFTIIPSQFTACLLRCRTPPFLYSFGPPPSVSLPSSIHPLSFHFFFLCSFSLSLSLSLSQDFFLFILINTNKYETYLTAPCNPMQNQCLLPTWEDISITQARVVFMTNEWIHLLTDVT